MVQVKNPTVKKAVNKTVRQVSKPPTKATQTSQVQRIPQSSPIIEKISDPVLKETVISTKQMGIKINYAPKLQNSYEIEEYFKEEIGSYLNEQYNEVHERVSELIKSGYDGKVWSFKLMFIPLKIKIFLSTGNRKDFNNVTKRLNEILKEVVLFEEKKKAKEEMKELKEKRREELRKAKEKAKEQSVKVIKKKATPKKIIKK